MIKRMKALACGSLIVALNCQASLAQKQTLRVLPEKPPAFTSNSRETLPDWTWAKEKWTGSDAPFVKLRQQIDAQVRGASRPKLDELVERYAKAAAAKSSDALAQFAWGYAVLAAHKAGRRVAPYGVQGPISFALAKPKSPRSYEYARMRFIMALWWNPNFKNLKPLGLRLLQRDLDDYDVKFWIISALNPYQSEEDKKLRLRYAQEMMKAQPTNTNSISSLGFAYKSVFLVDKSLSAGDKSIVAYRKLLSMIPAEETKRRQEVERVIAHIRKRQAQWKRNGTAKP